MKIALLTLGTRGDTQPFIALGKALNERGHDVVLGVPDNFQSWVEGHGLTYRSIGVDMQAFVQSIEARKLMAGNPLSMVRMWRNTIVPLTRRSLDAIWEIGRDADVIVYHPKTAAAADVGEATGAALLHAAPFPVFPTKSFPLFVFPGTYSPWLNRLTYNTLHFSRLIFLPTVNQWRKDALGLGKASLCGATVTGKRRRPEQLCAVSPTVLPDYPADGTENIQTTGYWFLDEGRDWRPDSKLSAFLDEGDPPVYIGFGSMTTRDPRRFAETILSAVRLAGIRAVLAIGWGAIGEIDVPETIHVISGAPHDALFERVSAVVHHGGAGTTAAGLRAGRPTLICPLTVDQPFWGRRIFSLGCGPKSLPLKRLTAERLGRGITELTGTKSYRVRAREVASAIAEEDGVSRAVEIVEAAGC